MSSVNISKNKRILIQLLFLFYLLIQTPIMFGQVSQGGIPYSLQLISKEQHDDKNENVLSKDIPMLEMPLIDQSTIEELKTNNNKEQKTYQFAYSFDTIIDVKKYAVKDSIDCGFLYRLAITSVGAYSINIIFSEYHVPPCAKLFYFF